MLRYAEKILEYQRENGTRQLICSGLRRLKNTLFLYQKEVVGCLSVVDPIPCANPKIPVIIRAADLSDVPELKVLSASYKRRSFSTWINSNYIFYIAQLSHPLLPPDPSVPQTGGMQTSVANKRIVGYVCVCPAKKSSHKLVSILKLKDTDYWAVDAFIHADYRGKGINSAIASEFLAQARREGYTRGYGTILYSNNASRSSYAHIGEKEIGIFTTLTIMGCSFYSLKKNAGYDDYFN